MLLPCNTFVKSGLLEKNDQNQQTWLQIKSAAIFEWITFFIWNFQRSFMAYSMI